MPFLPPQPMVSNNWREPKALMSIWKNHHCPYPLFVHQLSSRERGMDTVSFTSYIRLMSLQSTITNVSYSNFGFVHAKRGEFVADFYQLVGQRKSFENRLTFGDVVGRSLVSCFLTHGVETLCQQNLEEHSEKMKNKTVGESNRKCGEIAFAFAWLIKKLSLFLSKLCYSVYEFFYSQQ